MIADLADGVIQPLQRLADPLPGQLGGLARGRVQAEPDVEQAQIRICEPVTPGSR